MTRLGFKAFDCHSLTSGCEPCEPGKFKQLNTPTPRDSVRFLRSWSSRILPIESPKVVQPLPSRIRSLAFAGCFCWAVLRAVL